MIRRSFLFMSTGAIVLLMYVDIIIKGTDAGMIKNAFRLLSVPPFM